MRHLEPLTSSFATGSGEVAQPSPDLWDWCLELAEGDRSALLQTGDVVRHGEVRDERRRRAHPRHLRRFVIDHERVGRREIARQPVPVAQLWADRLRANLWTVVDLECS